MNKYIEKIERFLLKGLRYVYNRGKTPVCYHTTIDGTRVNDYIRERLGEDRPFMVGRLGTELYTAIYPYTIEQPLLKRYSIYIHGFCPVIRENRAFAEQKMSVFCNNCGFFPNNVELLKEYKDLLWKDIPEVDLLGCFSNEDILMPYFKGEETCPLIDLEPYDYAQPWSRALAGKKVLIVHPFAETIEKQYQKREQLWENKDVLPEFELTTIKAVQSLAGEKTPFNDWFEALNYMEQQMDTADYDIAIIGCGAYGFHLAAHAKRKGKKAIHFGGATQILFGIKGKRWDENPEVNKFYNENWVYPSADETPQFAQNVEGGCYW